MSRAEDSEPIVLGGRYRLLEALATGGMATVYLARQRGRAGFARTVAIKRMHPHFAEEHDFKALFMDEARLAARITHPNVVQTLDVVEDADELFIVMEYVKGLPLSQLQKLADLGHGVPVDVACSIAVGALQGLHAAHGAKDEAGHALGIVHRDVSPQNILVGVDGVARLIDFGVAKAAAQLHTTREGELRGKLAYMAPEQIRGGVADPQTDVFSASVVLWQALAGRRLFVGNNDGELIYRLLEAEVAPPSAHRAGIPAELDRIVLKGLSRDRAVRYMSALEMVHDLEESVKISRQSAVADWVQDIAHEVLKEQSAVLSDLLEQASLHDDPDTMGALRVSRPSVPGIHAEGNKTPKLFPMMGGVAQADTVLLREQPKVEDGTATIPRTTGDTSDGRAAETDSQLWVDTKWARPDQRKRLVAFAGVSSAVALVVLAASFGSESSSARLSTSSPPVRDLALSLRARATPASVAEPMPPVDPPTAAPKARGGSRAPRLVKAHGVPKPPPSAQPPTLYKRE